MADSSPGAALPCVDIVNAMGEESVFKAGDAVKIAVCFPVGHYAPRNHRQHADQRHAGLLIRRPAAGPQQACTNGHEAESRTQRLSGG